MNQLKINEVNVKFSNKEMTAYGGMALIAGFLEKLKFKENIKKIIPIIEKSNNAMGIDAKILSFLVTIFSGGNRFSHLLYIGESFEVFKKLFKVKKLPKSPTALTRDLFQKIKRKKTLMPLKSKCFEYIRTIIPWDKIKEDHLSFDSKVITRYGNQKKAKKGYNRKKPGRKSHHPICAFITKNKYIVNLKNRAGNSSSADGIVEFFEEAYSFVKTKMKVLGVLADSGFYLIEFIKKLEKEAISYVIAVPFSQTIQRNVLKIKFWEKVTSGIEISEFKFQHEDNKWDKERRYIVVRQEEKVLKQPKGKQMTLDLPDMDYNKYKYSVYITDKEDKSIDIWHEYRLRPNDENTFKELQEDFGFDTFAMKGFYSTEASMIIRVLFYNIFNLFRDEIFVTKKDPKKEMLKTIRYKYFIVPAIFSSHARKPTLTLNIGSKKIRAKMKSLINKVNQYVPSFYFESNALETEF
jgi:hypothetical protein